LVLIISLIAILAILHVILNSIFNPNINNIDISGKSSYGYILGRNGKEHTSFEAIVSHITDYSLINILTYDKGIRSNLTLSFPYVDGPIMLSVKQKSRYYEVKIDSRVLIIQKNDPKIYRYNKLIDNEAQC